LGAELTWPLVDCGKVTEVDFYLKSYPETPHLMEARECLMQAAENKPRFTDGCADCPDLVLIPPGTFTMGSKRNESGRTRYEGPRHEVTISVPFGVGVHEVTRGEFARFVDDTGYPVLESCGAMDESDGRWKRNDALSWTRPGYPQTDRHPVVCVRWVDAMAYVAWLSNKAEGKYRLLSESEWEYVARAGTDTPRHWGRSTWAQCDYENGLDRTFTRQFRRFGWRPAPCSDGHVRTAPVASFDRPNGFGLHDILGNVREWVADCWHDRYTNPPTDGSPWGLGGDCQSAVVRGGSWANPPIHMRSAMRAKWEPGSRGDVLGFRVARSVHWGRQ